MLGQCRKVFGRLRIPAVLRRFPATDGQTTAQQCGRTNPFRETGRGGHSFMATICPPSLSGFFRECARGGRPHLSPTLYSRYPSRGPRSPASIPNPGPTRSCAIEQTVFLLLHARCRWSACRWTLFHADLHPPRRAVVGPIRGRCPAAVGLSDVAFVTHSTVRGQLFWACCGRVHGPPARCRSRSTPIIMDHIRKADFMRARIAAHGMVDVRLDGRADAQASSFTRITASIADHGRSPSSPSSLLAVVLVLQAERQSDDRGGPEPALPTRWPISAASCASRACAWHG